MVNNYYQPGSGSGRNTQIFAPSPDSTPGGLRLWGMFYVDGNIMMNVDGTVNNSVSNDNWNGIFPNPNSKPKSELRSDVEFDSGQVTTHTAHEAYDLVLTNAGASLRRDATDARIVDETRNGRTPTRASGGQGTRAGLIDSQKDVGGWDTYSYRSIDIPADTDGDGIPDEWEIRYGLDPNDPSDGVKTNLSGGTYTNLEVYLYDLVRRK